mgnify:CR=1 FL=1
MKTLCSMALKTVLLCACFSSVLFACEDGETVEPTEKKPLVFNEPYFEKLSKPLSEDLIYRCIFEKKRCNSKHGYCQER